MAYENILFHQKHLVVIDGYFYLLDYTQRLLSQKTSAGATSFQYPVDIPNSFTSYTVRMFYVCNMMVIIFGHYSNLQI